VREELGNEKFTKKQKMVRAFTCWQSKDFDSKGVFSVPSLGSQAGCQLRSSDMGRHWFAARGFADQHYACTYAISNLSVAAFFPAAASLE
jgi:hypothetical protein